MSADEPTRPAEPRSRADGRPSISTARRRLLRRPSWYSSLSWSCSSRCCCGCCGPPTSPQRGGDDAGGNRAGVRDVRSRQRQEAALRQADGGGVGAGRSNLRRGLQEQPDRRVRQRGAATSVSSGSSASPSRRPGASVTWKPGRLNYPTGVATDDERRRLRRRLQQRLDLGLRRQRAVPSAVPRPVSPDRSRRARVRGTAESP